MFLVPCSGFSWWTQPGISQPVLMKPISAAWCELLCTCAYWSPSFLSHTTSPVCQVRFKFSSHLPKGWASIPLQGQQQLLLLPPWALHPCWSNFPVKQKVWAWLRHPVLLLPPINFISFLFLWLSNKSITRQNCKGPQLLHHYYN